MNGLMSATSLALILALGLDASAQDAGETKAEDKVEQGSTERRTIRGTVAGVSVVGETMIDYETNRAAIAQMSYLTILGSPRLDEADHGGKGTDPRGSPEARKDPSSEGKDQVSGHGSQGEAGSAQRRRPNVYLVAITPQTEVCEDSGSGDDSPGAKNSASRETQGQSLSSFERLELGDWVEVEFRSEHATTRRTIDRRHGRHRTFRGLATSITILPEEDGDDYQGPGSSSTQGNKTSNQDEKM